MQPRSTKNILVVRNDRFGEFLLNIPAFRALRETFVNARLIVVVNHYVKELVEFMPLTDEVILWNRRKHTFFEKLQLLKLLKSKNIDIAIMLNPSKEFNIFTYLAGIPVRVGYNRKWGFLLTHKIEDKKYLGQKHEVEYNLELVGLVGAKTEDKTISLKVDNDIPLGFDIDNYDNLIAIHPFTSDPLKQWPIEYFRNLAQKITRELNIEVVIIGGKQEAQKSLEYFADLSSRIFNLTGKTTLIQLAGLLKRCKLLISGDSGPVHLACAVGTPVIAIFRNDIPGKSARRWGPWGRGHIVIEKDNLYNIIIDEVFNKVKEKLNK